MPLALARQLSPPFNECPSIGQDTGCGILIEVTNGGQSVYADGSQPPFDGIEDTLIGVVNDSSGTVTTLQLSGNTDLFGFDGDGICGGGYSGTPSGCPFGTTGYEGPGTSFSNINAGQTGGNVDFSPGIPAGGTAYFSLEEPLSTATVFSGGPSTAEQGAAPNASEKATTCSGGWPVNCATGDFWHTFTDAAVPGLGASLDFTRTYSSASAANDGPLGFGWTDSYAMSLSFDSSGNATITQEDGSVVSFIDNGGSYVAPPWVLATFAANGDGTYTLTRDSNNVQYVFDSNGRLIRIVDRHGYPTTLTYDASGELTTITDQAGRSLTLSYSNGHISQLSDPMGNTTSFAYDSDGNLIGATDPLGRTWKFAYDANHLMLSMVDPRGGTVANTYDGSGRVVGQVDAAGRKTTWSYSGDPASTTGSTTTITDPRGTQATYAYSNLELTSMTRAAGTSAAATTTYTYDPATLGRATVTDPDGHVATNTYDARGDLTSTTDPLGNVTQYTYDGQGDRLTATDPLGTTTTYAYDSNGNLLTSTTPTGGGDVTWTYTYGSGSSAGERLTATNPNGKTTSYAYDADGDVTSVTDPLGNVTIRTFDQDGRLMTSARPSGATTSYAYDADGELTKTADPLGHSTSYAYDADGNRSSATDAGGHKTTYAYDADNERTQTDRPDGTTLKTGYDADGNVISQTDANGHVTAYAYDLLDRVTRITDPNGRTTTETYDPAGNVLTTVDASGATTTYAYDADNRVTSVGYSGAKTPSVTESYDADGRRVQMTDGTGTSSYSYDELGRLTQQTDGNGQTIGYTYDAAGNVVTITYPNGQAVSRGFDADGRLTSVAGWAGGDATFSYDADGNLVKEQLPNGVTAASTYDAAGRLTAIADTPNVANFRYSRNALGAVTAGTAGGATSATDAYSYDALNRLNTDNASVFGYDAAGNATGFGAQTQTFDAADQLLTSTPAAPSGGGSQSGGAPTPAGQPAPAPAGQPAPASSTGTGGPRGSVQPPPVPVLHRRASAALTRLALASSHRLGRRHTLRVMLSTRRAGALVVAFVSARASRAAVSARLAARGLSWRLVSMSTSRGQLVGIWQARARTSLTRTRVSVSLRGRRLGALLTVVAFDPGATIGGWIGRASRTGHPRFTINAPAGGQIWTVGGAGAAPAPPACARMVARARGATRRSALWVQYQTERHTGRVTIADRGGRAGGWSLASVVVAPGATASGAALRAARALLTGFPASGSRRTFTYDANGNRTSVTSGATTVRLTYDQANRLTGVGDSIGYSYDGDGLRAAKTVNGTTTQFAWDESGALPLLLGDGNSYYVYGPNGQPLEQITDNHATFLLTDQQGSVRVLIDEAGSVIGTYTYDAWGNVTTHTGTATADLQYDGQYTDAETGFQYLRARYYDPSTGQFLTVDAARGVTLTPYGFTSDNPLNLSDPLGMFDWGHALKVSGVVVGTVGLAAAVCVVTACVGDAAIGAVAATATASTYVGFGIDAGSTYVGCQNGMSTDCGASIGQDAIDVGTFGYGKYIDSATGDAYDLYTRGGSLGYGAATSLLPSDTGVHGDGGWGCAPVSQSPDWSAQYLQGAGGGGW